MSGWRGIQGDGSSRVQGVLVGWTELCCWSEVEHWLGEVSEALSLVLAVIAAG